MNVATCNVCGQTVFRLLTGDLRTHGANCQGVAKSVMAQALRDAVAVGKEMGLTDGN